MGLLLARIEWKPGWRSLASRFPPIQLFERVTAPEDLEAVIAVESLTNPRLRDEVGDIRLVPPEDRVSGPGAGVIMAAFTHLDPVGSRFSDGSYGVFYAANDLDTAIAETRYHRERFMRATAEGRMEIDMRVYLVDLPGRCTTCAAEGATIPASTTARPMPPASIWRRFCARTAQTASPMAACADRAANARPCSGPTCSATAARNGICAISGTASASPASSKSGRWGHEPLLPHQEMQDGTGLGSSGECLGSVITHAPCRPPECGLASGCAALP